MWYGKGYGNMAQKRKKGRLRRLSNQLNSRKAARLRKTERSKLAGDESEVRREWEQEEPQQTQSVTDWRKTAKRSTRSALQITLFGSIGFFIIAAMIASYFIFFEVRSFSPEDIALDVQGPTSVAAGEVTTLGVSVVNGNPVPLEMTDIKVTYPDGTRGAESINQRLQRDTASLGAVRSNEQKRTTFRSRFFGQEGDSVTVNVLLEYRVADSNAIFSKRASFDVKLASAPLTLSVDSLRETTSGQELVFDVSVRSNSNEAIENVLLTSEYPFGFSFNSADPAPQYSETVWNLGTIEPEEEKTVTVRGTLAAQEREERVFTFTTGMQSAENTNQIATPIGSTQNTVLVKQPFIDLQMAINGSTEQNPAVIGGETARVDLSWKNNLDTKVTNMQIEVGVEGSGLTEESVSPAGGFYDSQDNTIRWRWQDRQGLESIASGERGEVGFSLVPKNPARNPSLRKGTISFTASVEGQRTSERDVPEMVEASIERTARISTQLDLSSRIVHFVGPFDNSGPMPPAPEEQTTYTVVWTVTNTSNPVENAVVTASLPPYAQWLGKIDPQNANISYDDVGGRIRWDIGEVPPGTGGQSGPRQVAFQVGLTPSVSQSGESLRLVENIVLEGQDTFTGATLRDTSNALSTKFDTDPQYRGRYESVR
jgi:hypothetical protein